MNLSSKGALAHLQAAAVDEPNSLPQPLIRFWQVNVELQRREILQNINLDIRAGEVVCVIGPSGCGKTTMLRAIGGLIPPSAGKLMFKNKDIVRPRQDIAIVFQDYGKALLPWRTAAGNVALAMEACGFPRKERALEIQRLLKMMGLANHADKFPNQMSGGMQQRLQIARCLAQRPSVILMDEPFGALDAMTRQTLQDEVLNIVRDTATTVFFVTHDLDEAVYLADRIIALEPNPGRIGNIFDVSLAKPRHQLETREDGEFLRLRRELFEHVKRLEK